MLLLVDPSSEGSLSTNAQVFQVMLERTPVGLWPLGPTSQSLRTVIGNFVVVDKFLKDIATTRFRILCKPCSYYAYLRWCSLRGISPSKILCFYGDRVSDKDVVSAFRTTGTDISTLSAISMVNLAFYPDSESEELESWESQVRKVPVDACGIPIISDWFGAISPLRPVLHQRFQEASLVQREIVRSPTEYIPLQQQWSSEQKPITKTAFARVGVLGNPSDMFFGTTLSCTISNFFASATISASEELRLVPHPFLDPTSFSSLADLTQLTSEWGYCGGQRLMVATCKKFHSFVSEAIARRQNLDFSSLRMSLRKNFALSYDTNIPRQVGLAGSSAIVVSILKCLIEFYEIEVEEDNVGCLKDLLNVHELPSLALSVEQDELGISAGLQDRVVQCWTGLVLMNFDKSEMEQKGHGSYTRLTLKSLPQLYLAIALDPSDSGKMHNNVRQRWLERDEKVLAAVEGWKAIVDKGVDALSKSDFNGFADCLDDNFRLRKDIYGEGCLGSKNLEMYQIAKKHQAAAKFPGSGGAMLMMPRSKTSIESLREDLEVAGYSFLPIRPVEEVA